jgi:hypothetical protein
MPGGKHCIPEGWVVVAGMGALRVDTNCRSLYVPFFSSASSPAGKPATSSDLAWLVLAIPVIPFTGTGREKLRFRMYPDHPVQAIFFHWLRRN